jgi:hypothetical protein
MASAWSRFQLHGTRCERAIVLNLLGLAGRQRVDVLGRLRSNRCRQNHGGGRSAEIFLNRAAGLAKQHSAALPRRPMLGRAL